MPIFSYKLMDRNGAISTYRIEKQTKNDVLEHLMHQGETVLEIKRLNILDTDIKELKFYKPQISKKQLAVFCRQLSFLLESGLTVVKALSVTEKITKNNELKNVVNNLQKEVVLGRSLSISMDTSKSFPKFLISMVEVGEKVGNLALIFENMADYYEKENKNIANIKNALTYPCLIFIAMFCLIIASIIYVVPNFVEIFNANGLVLPLATRILIGIEGFISKNIIFIIVVCSGVSVVAHIYFKSEKGKYICDSCLLNTPLFNRIYREMKNINFVQTICIMLYSGVPLLQALGIAKNAVNNSVLEGDILEVMNEMEKGEGLSNALGKKKYFNELLVAMAEVGEQTGKLPDSLQKCSEYLQNNLEQQTTNINKLLEPVIMVILGLLLLFIILAIMLPTFSLGNLI